MAVETTLAELEQRVRVLEKEVAVRRQVEADLRETESRYHTLFDSAGDALFIHDLFGCFLEINRSSCDRLGYQPGDFNNLLMGIQGRTSLMLFERRNFYRNRKCRFRRPRCQTP